MQLSKLQEDLFLVACYICACIKLQANLLREWAPETPTLEYLLRSSFGDAT